MNLYIAKPFEAVQFTKTNIQEIMAFLPEERFVFFGIETINGKDQKVFDDDLTPFRKIGGFLYYKKETKIIMENDWILKRKGNYEVLNNEYFQDNFMAIPFIQTQDLQTPIVANFVNTSSGSVA